MRKKILWALLLVVVGFAITYQIVAGQGRGTANPQLIAQRQALENELQAIAIVERKLMIPMRDGKRMAADLYRPKDTSKKYPTVFVRTPYNFNYGDVRNGAPRDMSSIIDAVKLGINKWQGSDTWPPVGAQPMKMYLASGGKANTGSGDGVLTAAAPATDNPDKFDYDPLNPVPSYGGNVCCTGNAVQGGAFDQRKMEERQDILVCSTEPLPEGIEVSALIEVTLYVSSDAKDTDFTIKLIDVYPDGRAYNLDETIQRMRYHNGYDKPLVWMETGKVYKVTLQPMVTSNYFAAGHRIRIEVSSSNFPRFDRNLNTGGKNYDEVRGVVAHNMVHHSRQYPSEVKLTVVQKERAGSR